MEIKKNESAEFEQYCETYKPLIEKGLRENLPVAPTHIETQFKTALEYALFQGEMRLRPILTLLGAELVEGKAEDVLSAAVAVEFVYASSLVFEDLFAKNEIRNGRESLHRKFGDDLAMLVGIGFLNAAYPLVFVNHSGMPERAMTAHSEIVECVGAAGLVGGQTIEISLETSVGGSKNQELETESLRNLKTSAIIRLSLRLGAILSGANYMELANLSRFAELLGDAYQMSDEFGDSNINLSSTVDEAKRVLIENFPSNEARSCLIQLTESLIEK
ncbi:MAG: polyprenyl synthetase family protein [Aridibacter sp.]